MKKKFLTILLCALSACALAIGFTACERSDSSDKLQAITGVTLTDETFDYDGKPHSLSVSGALPEGAQVNYTNNDKTAAGTYKVTACVTCSGYRALNLSATLKINGMTITGVMFEGDTVTYDGNSHPLAVSGVLPQGVSASYSFNNNAVDAGTYPVTVTLSGENYETLVVTKNLVIEKATMTGLSFLDVAFSYDALEHSIEIAGVVPENSQIIYRCAENKSITNAATETGDYTITAIVSNKNYVTWEASAKLKIIASENNRAIYAHGNTLYFANALDSDKLYRYDGSTIAGVSSDIPEYFAAAGSDLYFTSKSLYMNSIKSIAGSGVSSVSAVKGEYLCSDGSALYYAVNAFTNEKSGIYRLDLSGSEPGAVLLSQGKAKFLTCVNNDIYFADGANGWKLSRIATSGGARTVVVNEKITCLTASGTTLYFTIDNLLGNYIARYTLGAGEPVKMTSDAGACLTVLGSKLYYINIDLLNSAVFGKGIYCVSLAASSSLPGAKVIDDDANGKYSSLTAVNGKLAYYHVNDQMLCLYDVASDTEERLLEGFTPTETTPLNTGNKTAVYGYYVYYLDVYNNKALYSYNTQTGKKSRLTSEKVSDYAIIGDTLYYNAVSYGVNNDLYKVNLKIGGVPELVSKNDCTDIVTDGTRIYYIKKNAAGAATAITQISGGVETDIYDKGTEGLTYYKGYLYFVDGGTLYKIDFSGASAGVAVKVTTNANVKTVGDFYIDNDVIYFREIYQVNTLKRLSCIKTDGTGYRIMLTKNTDPLTLYVKDGYVYYYNDVISGTSGLHRISITANNGDTMPELLLNLKVGSINTYYAANFVVVGNQIYFINYRMNMGDSHLYAVDLTTKEVAKVA